MRRSNCAGALQYVPELTWILFLRILDEREAREQERARAVGAEFTPSLESPYRWRDWAAPGGPKRQQLQNGTLGAVLSFVNAELLPYLRGLRDKPGAAPQQKVGRVHRLCRDHIHSVEHIQEIAVGAYDLKAVNPNAKRNEDLRTPEELLDVIEAKGHGVAEAIAALRRML